MASASYYGNQQQPQQPGYEMQPPQGAYYSNNQPQYQPPYNNNGYGAPPNPYQPPPGPPPGPPPLDPKANDNYGAPPTFDEAFAVQKPKWNDLWAGILFLITAAGFVVVSAISIQGYGESARFRWPRALANFDLNSGYAQSELGWSQWPTQHLQLDDTHHLAVRLGSAHRHCSQLPLRLARPLVYKAVYLDHGNPQHRLRRGYRHLHALSEILLWWYRLPHILSLLDLRIHHLDPTYPI